MENKKNNKKKSITKPIKKNYKKNPESIMKILSKMRRLEKQILLTREIEICQMKIEREKKLHEKLLL